ncbi:MAG: hypothetical protein U0T72_09035 [Chitinophagales bacterium]
MLPKNEFTISKFIAAFTNANNVVHAIFQRIYQPQPSVQTISNAMDVGNPSNFARMQALFENSASRMQQQLVVFRFQ